ncbi:MAG: type 4 pilus major pilin [Bdellovibrionales bacterium]
MVQTISRFKKRAAFTLTEAALVFLIIGVVMTGLWVAVAAVYENSRISTTTKQLLEIVSRVRSLHGMSQSRMLDSGVNASVLAQAGLIPNDLVDYSTSPPTIHHLWRGELTITALTTKVSNDSFRIGLLDLPSSSCAALLMKMTGENRDEGLVSAGGAGSPIVNSSMPIGLSNAVGVCSSDPTNLYFSFMLKA